MKVFLLTLFLVFSANAQTYKKVVSKDKIEIVNGGFCQIREVTITYEDGKEIAKKYTGRWALEPGSDVSQFEARVQAICKSAWTPDVISAWKIQKEKQIAALPPIRDDNGNAISNSDGSPIKK